MFSKKGFTMVEIIVILVILATLAALTLPSMLGFVESAKRKSLAVEARQVYNAMQAYTIEHYALGKLKDEQLANVMNGEINSSHVLYGLLKGDVGGTISNVNIENGRVRSFRYVKDIGDDLVASFDLKTGWAFNGSSNNTPELNADELEEQVIAVKQQIISDIYPVGSYYISGDSTSPATLFKFGTWERVNNEFLYCMGNNAKKPDNSSVNLSVGGTGGSATHKHTTSDCTLTIEQIPPHKHVIGHYGWLRCASGDEKPCLSKDAILDNDFNTSGFQCNDTGGKDGVTQAHNHGDTGSSSNIPPYVAVYCWRRTT